MGRSNHFLVVSWIRPAIHESLLVSIQYFVVEGLRTFPCGCVTMLAIAIARQYDTVSEEESGKTVL